MAANYQRELDELKCTFEEARRTPIEKLQRACLDLATGPAMFVGTGGTVALAQLASDLHTSLSRQLGVVATPLEFLQSPPLDRCGAMFFSARAKHPDAQLTLKRLASGDFIPAILATHRDPTELEQISADVDVVQLTAPRIPEGFLATNSILTMATQLVRAFGSSVGPNVLSDLDYTPPKITHRPVILVLYPPQLKAVAIDLETRCSELGLASVQITDLRNVAHGRHTGLVRRGGDTTVVLLSDTTSRDLASRICAVLDDANVPLIRWHADLPSAEACLRLLAGSMQVVGQLAESIGVDPARPQVPEFGRRLYNLPIKKLLRRPPEGPVDLKTRALGAGPIDKPLSDVFRQGFEEWRTSISKQRFGGIVVDYDGTVCATRKRYELPDLEIQTAILRVLDGGLRIGFATGRGKSIHEDLRKWIPERHWARIHLGLYNGAVRLTLADSLPDLRTPSDLMRDIAARLSSWPFERLISIEARAGQVTIASREDAFFHDLCLARIARDLLQEKPAIDAKVVSSGHSVDLLAPDTTKVTVLREVEATCGRPVLAVGDQGQSGGNDFELLAASKWSLSVDRCSADPTRCWRISRADRRGPAGLAEILKALKISDATARLPVRAEKR